MSKVVTRWRMMERMFGLTGSMVSDWEFLRAAYSYKNTSGSSTSSETRTMSKLESDVFL